MLAIFSLSTLGAKTSQFLSRTIKSFEKSSDALVSAIRRVIACVTPRPSLLVRSSESFHLNTPHDHGTPAFYSNPQCPSIRVWSDLHFLEGFVLSSSVSEYLHSFLLNLSVRDTLKARVSIPFLIPGSPEDVFREWLRTFPLTSCAIGANSLSSGNTLVTTQCPSKPSQPRDHIRSERLFGHSN